MSREEFFQPHFYFSDYCVAKGFCEKFAPRQSMQVCAYMEIEKLNHAGSKRTFGRFHRDNPSLIVFLMRVPHGNRKSVSKLVLLSSLPATKIIRVPKSCHIVEIFYLCLRILDLEDILFVLVQGCLIVIS